MDDRKDPKAELAAKAPEALDAPGEPPVVARLVVEIRSDGSRTIARGALEDLIQGVKVGVQAEGKSPVELATALARSMFQLPVVRGADRRLGALGRKVRALLPGKKR